MKGIIQHELTKSRIFNVILKRVVAAILATGMIASNEYIVKNSSDHFLVQAANSDMTYGALSYTINTDNNGTEYVVITSCAAEADDVVIPNEIGGLPVKAIGDNSFSKCKILSSVKLSEGIEIIGDSAFNNCKILKKIELPSTLKSIGNKAFASCIALANLSMQDGIITIGDEAFAGCSSLKEVLLPNTVNGIGSYAFLGCKNLSKINIPDSVTEIKTGAFEDTHIINNQKYSIKYVDNWLVYCDWNDKEIKDEYIQKDTVGIADYVFANNETLRHITFNDELKYIGKYAFTGCSLLTSIVIPEGVTEIREGTFNNCHSLSDVSLPKNLISIGDGAFEYRYEGRGDGFLSSITFPNGLITIGNRAFLNRSRITEVIIPDSVQNIGDEAFMGCKLKKVELGNSVQTIGNYAFCCASRKNDSDTQPRYTEITIPKSVNSIGKKAFGYYDNDTFKKYSLTINGYLHSDGERYAKENGFTFKAIGKISLQGDLNADGLFNASDVLLLQKWLMDVSDTILVDSEAADLIKDDKLNISDLCMMKSKLIYG